MKELLYIGKFSPWKESNEDELFEALKIFDKVRICVMVSGKKVKKGQPTKIVDEDYKDRIAITKFKRIKNLLNVYKNSKYILFER